ncbi:CLPTM1L [Symbiodinium sp. CCMP2592]|nr:CLPTM1L [Symbiodinium sp. CCMP2592]
MGMLWRALQVLFVWYLLIVGVQLHAAFRAPRCPMDVGKRPCYRPLFQEHELVNISVFLTTEKALQWWTDEGYAQLVHVLNATVSFGESSQLRTTLPLSSQLLQGVRRNESVLYVHCFVVRDGSRLAEEIRTGPIPELPGVISEHVLHTTAQIVRHQPQVQRSRRNLLAQHNDTSAAETAVEVTLIPGWNFVIYPRSCAYWAVSLFVVSYFSEPTLALAGVRHGLLAIVVPFLLQLSTGEAESGKAAALDAFQLSTPAPIVPHLVPFFRIEVATDFEVYDGRHPPPLLYKAFVVEHSSLRERDVRYTVLAPRHAEGPHYAPPFSVDTASFHSKSWTPVDHNASRLDPEMTIEVEFTGMIKHSIVQTLREAMKMYMHMGVRERDLEDLKEFFFRQPLHILIAYQVIGILQTTLRMLAFKNDITFFKGRSDYTGLSSRSLATDLVQEIVIFLYLYDFDSISRLLLLQLGMSAAISFWKYARVARLGTRWLYFLPWATYGRCTASSPALPNSPQADETSTEEADERGMRYLKYVLYPLSAGWGLYSLYHYSYKSWWSWVISSMADFAYTFGFVNMMPQIFINYKLKSVAHMPWRVLVYKFFNTFIDDIFAFVIAADQMTNKHRYMTLRDDVIFFIFLYQRHIYKVDPNRPDEFGNVYDDNMDVHKKAS